MRALSASSALPIIRAACWMPLRKACCAIRLGGESVLGIDTRHSAASVGEEIEEIEVQGAYGEPEVKSNLGNFDLWSL
jgi:hypothetical protein